MHIACKMKLCVFTLFCLYFMIVTAAFDLDCGIDKFHRENCWTTEGTNATEEICLENPLCCWDSTWEGVPMCYFAIGPTTTTETTAPVTSPASVKQMTTASSDMSPAMTSLTAEPGLGGNTASSDTSPVMTSSTVGLDFGDNLDRELERILSDTENSTPQMLSDLLTSSIQDGQENITATLDKVLSAAIALSGGARNISTAQRVDEWLNFYDKLLNISGLKTVSTAKMFLNSSSQVLIDELLTPNATINQSAASSVVISLEKYAIAMATTLLSNDQTPLVLSYKHNNFSFCQTGATSSECDVTNDYVTSSVDSKIDSYQVTRVAYNFVSDAFLPSAEFEGSVASLGSPLFSVALHRDEEMLDSAQINLTFQKTSDNISICAFINSTTGSWSSSGCTMTSQTPTSASCSCNHNTSFALLFLHSDIQISEQEEQIFNIITFIGCGTSITALLLTIFTFLYLKLTRVKRIVLHLNLAATLCLGQIVLLIGNTVATGTVQCKVIAILIHFFFMASFSWMLMEGILLYYQSVRAVAGQVNFNVVIAFGWLLPFVIVGVSLAAGYNGYGQDRGCWLSVNNGLIWAFIGPALGFILINLILMVMIIHVFMKLKTNSKGGEWLRAKRTIRAIVVLTPLLGITWLFGVLAVDDSTKWFLYLFSIFNSFQGLFIFILHCLRNEDVRKSFVKKYRKSVNGMGPFFSTIAPSSGKSGSTFVKTNTSHFTSTPRMPHKPSW